MKFIIIGLGSFGSSLADKLIQSGHEVIGVDIKMSKIDAFKENLTHAICLDSTDPHAVSHLPLKDTDAVIICIGEDEGANILSTALMKKIQVKRIISRAISPLHETVLEAMGISEIVRPEEETADRWSRKLNFHGVVNSFNLTSDYSIVEVIVPEKFVGKTLAETQFPKNYNVVILTTIKMVEEKNFLGITKKVKRVQDVASSVTILDKGDILVAYGHTSDIERLLRD